MTHAHWHKYNPWKDKVLYIHEKHARMLISDEYIDAEKSQYGETLDYYLLPQPKGRFSMGIRYGCEDYEYLSPYVDDKKADIIFQIYMDGVYDIPNEKE